MSLCMPRASERGENRKVVVFQYTTVEWGGMEFPIGDLLLLFPYSESSKMSQFRHFPPPPSSPYYCIRNAEKPSAAHFNIGMKNQKCSGFLRGKCIFVQHSDICTVSNFYVYIIQLGISANWADRIIRPCESWKRSDQIFTSSSSFSFVAEERKERRSNNWISLLLFGNMWCQPQELSPSLLPPSLAHS